jgi:hypothetical protein
MTSQAKRRVHDDGTVVGGLCRQRGREELEDALEENRHVA